MDNSRLVGQLPGVNWVLLGSFVPLRVSKLGEVMREVAPASIALALPEHPGERLLLTSPESYWK